MSAAPDPSFSSFFLIGCAGAIATEILAFYNMRKRFVGLGFIKFVSMIGNNFGYFIALVPMTLFGGGLVLAYLYSGSKLNALLALNVGASAPLFIGKTGTILPNPLRDDSDANNS